MLPQIVRTLMNWFPGRSEQHSSVISIPAFLAKNAGGFCQHLPAKFFIPQRLTPDSGDLLSESMIQAKESTGSLEIWDVLAAMSTAPEARCIAVIGRPGSGKTTLLEYLHQIYEGNYHKQIHSGVPNLIPLRFCLRDIQQMIQSDRSPSLLELITPEASPQQRKKFETHFQRGQYLVMFDGLDQVNSWETHNNNTSKKLQVIRWIDRQMQTYAATPFIITSRPRAYELNPLQNVGIVLELQPLNDRQIQQFLQTWYQLNLRQTRSNFSRSIETDEQVPVDRIAQLLTQIKSVRSVGEMATNPLLLKAIALVYDTQGQIPSRRVKLYQALCDVLLTDKSLSSSVNQSQILSAKKDFLQKLALGLMQQKASQFTGNKLRKLLGDNVELFAKIENFGGLLQEIKPGVYEFTHLSFQEYFAGVAIKESQQEELLIKNIQDPWWHETIKFYTAISETNTVIQAALSDPATLNLADACLRENLTIPGNLKAEFQLTLATALDSSNPMIVQSAAKIRLKQRCQELLNRPESVAIDLGYITNAEYQLFIDDQRKVGQSRQPDHWPNKRFAPGKARSAIAGVRGSDAEEFCEWLTQQYAGFGIRFRLPTLAEVQADPATEKHLGAWCYDEKDKAIAGVSPELWQQWQEKIAIALEDDLDRLRRQQQALKLDLTRDLTRSIALQLARSQKKQLIHQLDQQFQKGISHDMVKNLNHIHELVFGLGNVDNFYQIRDFALKVSKFRQLFALRKMSRITQIEIETIREYFLLIYICFFSLDRHYRLLKKESRSPTTQIKIYDRNKTYYQQKKNEALNLYAFFMLIYERHLHEFPAFEGIRIVKDQVE
jgi:energy-coupling factor transporter ATP-binding protein EcfA2